MLEHGLARITRELELEAQSAMVRRRARAAAVLLLDQASVFVLVVWRGGSRVDENLRVTRLGEGLDELHLAALELELERVAQECTEEICRWSQGSELDDLSGG